MMRQTDGHVLHKPAVSIYVYHNLNIKRSHHWFKSMIVTGTDLHHLLLFFLKATQFFPRKYLEMCNQGCNYLDWVIFASDKAQRCNSFRQLHNNDNIMVSSDEKRAAINNKELGRNSRPKNVVRVQYFYSSCLYRTLKIKYTLHKQTETFLVWCIWSLVSSIIHFAVLVDIARNYNLLVFQLYIYGFSRSVSASVVGVLLVIDTKEVN